MVTGANPFEIGVRFATFAHFVGSVNRAVFRVSVRPLFLDRLRLAQWMPVMLVVAPRASRGMRPLQTFPKWREESPN